MKESTFRIFLGQAITVSEKLSNPVKLQLLEYVKKADLHELMSIVLDGEVKPLDDQAAELLEQRFKRSEWPAFIEESMITEVGRALNIIGMIMLTPIVWAQWRALFAIFSKAHRQCGVLRVSKDRDTCLKKARMQMSMNKMKLLQKAKAGCKKYKNPQACAKTLDVGIAKEKKKIDKYQTAIQKLAMKGRVGPGSEPEKGTMIL